MSSRTSSPSFSFLYSSILFMACPPSRACRKNAGRKECATDVSKGLRQDNCMRAEKFSLLPAQAGGRRADRARAPRAADRQHFAARAAEGCTSRTAALRFFLTREKLQRVKSFAGSQGSTVSIPK